MQRTAGLGLARIKQGKELTGVRGCIFAHHRRVTCVVPFTYVRGTSIPGLSIEDAVYI